MNNEKNKMIDNELFEKIIKNLIDTNKEILYLPKGGIINSKTQIYNHYIHLSFKQIFILLEKCSIDYYVFAGSAIGYVRNKKNIPWADDYDIMIFMDEKEKLEKNFLPLLEKNGFTYGLPHVVRPDLYPRHGGWQISGRNINGISFFLFDIFLSIIDDDGFIRNNGNFGVYHTKNIPFNLVKPKQYLKFEDMNLPFFNNIEEYVKLEYGDVINQTKIYIAHSSNGVLTLNENWKKVYMHIYYLIKIAKQNTNKIIFKNNNFTYKNNLIVKKDFFNNEFDVLQYINLNNIGKILFDDLNFLKFCFTIKYYYPKIKIHYYIYEMIEYIYIFELNFVDKIFVSNKFLLEKINDTDIVYLNKPQIKLITVITFGTFDLFHIGHENILKNCKKYGNKVVVGVSSDKLNLKKGKKSINNYDKRVLDVIKTKTADLVFKEKSLDLKNKYVEYFDADLLIMGDDWKDKFDFVNCMTKYLPRTPNISTTMLKEKILTKNQ